LERDGAVARDISVASALKIEAVFNASLLFGGFF